MGQSGNHSYWALDYGRELVRGYIPGIGEEKCNVPSVA